MSSRDVVALAPRKFNFMTPSQSKQAFEVSLRSRNRRGYQDDSSNDFSSPKNFTLSASDLMDSNVELVCDLKFRVEGGDWDAVEKLGDKIGLRPFPINSALQNASVTGLNGIAPTSTPYENITFYSRVLSVEKRAGCSQAYTNFESDVSYQSETNNVYRWGASTDKGEQSNGFGNGYEVVALNETTVSGTAGIDIHLRIKERVQAPPFQWWMCNDNKPFNQVGQFQLQLQFRNDAFHQIVGVASGESEPTLKKYNSSEALTSTTQGAFQVEAVIETMIPSASISVPPHIVYDSPRINYYSTNASSPSLASGASDSQTVNLGNYNNVPTMWAVYMKEDETATRTDLRAIDRHAVITKLQVQIGSNNVALADLDVEGLYRMSSKNGYNGTLGSFSGSLLGFSAADPIRGNGQVIYFKPSDLALNDIFYVPNSASQPINVSITVDYKNPYDTAFSKLKLYVLALEDKVLDTQYNSWKEIRPVLTGAQITNAPLKIADLDESTNQLGGASILDSLKRGWKDVGNFFKKHKGTIKNVRQLGDLASDAAVMAAPELAPAKVGWDMASKAMASQGYGLEPVAGKRGRPRKTASKKGGKGMNTKDLMKLLNKI